MTQIETLNIFFVLPSQVANENDCSTDMVLAFETTVKYGGKPKWKKPSFCMSYSGGPNDVFVLDKFEGECFEKLKKGSTKVIGSRCMLTCVTEGRSIPSGPAPVFTEGMRNLEISVTGFDTQTRKNIKERVEYMGGTFDKSLKSVTTHIVSWNNMSTKAIESFKINIPLMKPEWIDAVWEKSLELNVNGGDKEFIDAYRTPVLFNVNVTTSGIVKSEKDSIKQIVEKLGGVFCGSMEQFKTNVVILTKPVGDKFKFAKSWKIPCVTPDWLYRCDRESKVLPVSGFEVEADGKRTSTPTREGTTFNFTANISAISRAQSDTERDIRHVDETNTNATKASFLLPLSVRKDTVVSQTQGSGAMNISLKELRECGSFLNSCNVYLHECEVNNKYRKILESCGASVAESLSDRVTHVLVSNSTLNSFVKCKAQVVKCEWLLESVRLKKRVSEELYLVQNNIQSQSIPGPIDAVQPLNFDDLPEDDIPVPFEELLQKYESQPAEEAFKELDLMKNKSNNISNVVNKAVESVSNSALADNTSVEYSFFKKLKFFLSDELTDEERENIGEIIVEFGGSVAQKRFVGVPDYAVVPVCVSSLPDVTAREVVNIYFIKDCCAVNKIVPLLYYHYPVALKPAVKPLQSCVISVSNYVSSEREFIEQLVSLLGAVSQPLLARREKANVLRSTHLICMEPTGQKYEGAIKWDLPVVSHQWLLKCAALGIRVSEAPYLVGESKLSTTVFSTPKPKTTDKIDVKSNLNIEKVTPASKSKPIQNSFLSQKNDTFTPALVNPPVHQVVARLKHQETPKSGDTLNHTMTPTSPYGAFYGNENPSPGTRKRILKWINQEGADFPQDPPVSMQQESNNSTPISELLRRQVSLMKRKPEDQPPDDSPVPPSFKRLNLDQSESDVITAALQGMKELAEVYKSTNEVVDVPRIQTPDRDAKPQLEIVAESQPHTEIGWGDPLEKQLALDSLERNAESLVKVKVFMLSGFTDDCDATKALIEELGGKVSELQSFDKNATHLITCVLGRAEKVMGSVAAGLWVLHPSYIKELKQVKSLYMINEEDFEWGNPSRAFLIESMAPTAKELALSSYYWRSSIKSGEPPPFKDMKIILCYSDSKFESFKRVLEAGGAEVIKPSADGLENVSATLCICDTSYQIDLKLFAKQGIPCVGALYISDRIFRKITNLESYFVSGYKST